ncbi:DUF485 domain-containing protein [Flexivirga meconopsidis]|uniref:DUF485 domain-containing protein n=1 Tax=Flexivirga meconopsidis TaxID=2977121 RepID=UPI0022409025|nr:DUF485 domain-containing protein [Flexivirga meconopsidis]
MSSGSELPADAAQGYLRVEQSPEFKDLRSRFRRFVFPMTAVFLIWYFAYVLLGAYAHDFMAHKLFGNITVGLVLGLLQFVSTFAITMIYVRWANRVFDPAAEKLAASVGLTEHEGGEQR